MSNPFIGEIRMFGGSFAPVGWALCNGSPQAISQNDALFQLIGTTYGGDGETTFNLPNLQSRVPMHAGTGPSGTTYTLGEMAGVESVTLTTQQIPAHTHALLASTDSATKIAGTNGVVAAAVAQSYLFAAPPDTNLNANMVTPVGGSQPHDNLQPYLAVTFIFSLFGLFPHQ